MSYVYTFPELTMTLDLLWKGSHIHIFSVIFFISMMLMNLDNFHVETLLDSKKLLLMVFNLYLKI